MTTDPYRGRLVRLRAREPQEAPLLQRWFNDPLVAPGIQVRYPQSRRAQEKRMESLAPSEYAHVRFTIETLEGGRPIGTCSYSSGPAENRSSEIGIQVGEKDFWDGGYGTDAMRVLCRAGFEAMNLHRIELFVFADNPRAIRCYEKVGFVREGVLRDAGFWAGKYRDLVVMSLFRNEFVLEDR